VGDGTRARERAQGWEGGDKSQHVGKMVDADEMLWAGIRSVYVGAPAGLFRRAAISSPYTTLSLLSSIIASPTATFSILLLFICLCSPGSCLPRVWLASAASSFSVMLSSSFLTGHVHLPRLFGVVSGLDCHASPHQHELEELLSNVQDSLA